jgi:hypothetical protein
MKLPLKFLFLLLLCSTQYSYRLMAEQTFTEGSISYNVVITPAATQQAAAPQKGVYTISVKGNMLRKELKMENGYKTTILYNGNIEVGYSLQLNAGRKYAIQLSRDDLEHEQKPFAGFKTEDLEVAKDIVSMAAQHAKVVYSNKTECDLYYARNWQIADYLTFERFPGIKYLPLAFSYKNEQGMSFRFEAVQFRPGPVDNAIFRLPQDHKIITNREYKALSN